MAGLTLDMGLGASAIPGMASASVPAAAGASPQGPTTISQKAFGIVAGTAGTARTCGVALVGGGALSLIALAFIWWSLPR